MTFMEIEKGQKKEGNGNHSYHVIVKLVVSEIDGRKKWFPGYKRSGGNKWSAFQTALRGNKGSIYAFMFPSLPGKGFHTTFAHFYLLMSCYIGHLCSDLKSGIKENFLNLESISKNLK